MESVQIRDVYKYLQNHKIYCLYTAIHRLSKIIAIFIPLFPSPDPFGSSTFLEILSTF